jgi:hypothetical protein
LDFLGVGDLERLGDRLLERDLERDMDRLNDLERDLYEFLAAGDVVRDTGLGERLLSE